MKVGLFTDSYPPYINGVSTSAITLKQALEEAGHTVYIVTVGQDATTYDYDEKEKVLKVPGIPIGLYDYRASSIYPVKVVNKIKSWNLDVIHSYTELCMGIFARLFAKQHHIPLVHTYHTMYKDYTYYVSHNLKYFDIGCKKAVEYLSKFYCDNTANAFIVPTVKTYRLFRDEYHYQKDIFIVPTGIDAKRFYSENVDQVKVSKIKRELGYKKSDFVVLFVGRIAQEKNIEFLLKTMQMTKKMNKNIKLLIVGDGPDKEKYEAQCSILEIEDTVKFTGKIPWDNMPLYYHCADLFITASITETQGLTVIEALAADLPVVCIEDESFHTMVTEAMNGRFFKEEHECAHILEELASDKIQLKALKAQARKSAERYSLDQFAKSLIEVYKIADNNLKSKKDFQTIVRKTVRKIRRKKDDTSPKS